MIKRVFICCIVLVLLLGGCGDSNDVPSDRNRWTAKFDSEELVAEYLDVSQEEATKKYYANLEHSSDIGLVHLYRSVTAKESIEELHVVADPVLNNIKTECEKIGTYGEMKFVDYNGMIQIVGMTENRQSQFSVNIYLEGNLQAVGYYTWGCQYEEVPALEDICDMFKTYTGLCIGPHDLLKLQDEIISRGEIGGNYIYAVNDATTSDYFAVAVYNFDTEEEYWQCYASVNIE